MKAGFGIEIIITFRFFVIFPRVRIVMIDPPFLQVIDVPVNSKACPPANLNLARLNILAILIELGYTGVQNRLADLSLGFSSVGSTAVRNNSLYCLIILVNELAA